MSEQILNVEKAENLLNDDDISGKLEESCNIEGNFEFIAKSFDDLKLKADIEDGISAYGFSRPSPIQSRAIIPCINGKDVIAQAQSGTGKTATFVISTLQRIDTNQDQIKVQALVLAPTRELAAQIRQVYDEIGQFTGAKCLSLIGGTDVDKDIKNLQAGAHIIVGTPGRVIHMVNQKFLSCANIMMFILDEADEMLQLGFMDQIYQLFKFLPRDIQVILISATMPDNVLEVTKSFMRNPVEIFVKKDALTLQGIRQFYVVAESRDNKVDVIMDIIGDATLPQTVVFVNTQKDATHLCEVLIGENIKAAFTHAGLNQEDRDSILSKFRRNEIKILITTNLMSRGIDVQGVSLVINFDPPRDKDVYIHRIGRGGRYGRKGVAINLVLESEMKSIKDLETYYNTEILELPGDYREFLNN